MRFRITTPFGPTRIYRIQRGGNSDYAIVVPGYSESIAHSKALVDALAHEGFNAFTFSQPRKPSQLWSDDPIGRQADIVLRVVEASAPEDAKVVAVAHSLGAAAVLKAAPRAPQRFASIVLMQPIGLSGDQRLREQATRVARKATKNQLGALRRQVLDRPPHHGYAAAADTESALRFFARVTRAQLVGAGVLARQAVLALQEANAAGSYDMATDMEKVRGLGVPVHVVKAQGDELFEADKVDAGCQRIFDVVSSYSSVADPHARHDTCWLQPRRSAQIVSQLVRQGEEPS